MRINFSRLMQNRKLETPAGKVLDLYQAAAFGIRRFVDAKPTKRIRPAGWPEDGKKRAKRKIRNAMARNSRRLNRV